MFATLIVVLTLLAAYPLSAWLVSRLPGDLSSLLAPVLTLALSVGLLTLGMMWLGLLGVPLTFWSTVALYAPVVAAGWGLWWHLPEKPPLPRLPNGLPQRFALLMILGVVSASVFNAVYFPFYRDDTIGIYARHANIIYDTNALPALDIGPYEAYPMLMPLAYVYTYFAAGQTNEHLAKFVGVLLSLGCIPATYLLGRALHSTTVGWTAVLILAVMPIFGRWASSGYVDLPMAFYYTLAAYFAWRLWQHAHPVDVVLSGVMMGFATLTKNAALGGILVLACWCVWATLHRRINWRLAVVPLAVCFVIAAPYYIRNWLVLRLIVPDTAWVDQAQRTLSSLLVYITRPELFGVMGWLLLLGLGWGLGRFLRRPVTASNDGLLLLWVVPFFGAWWWLVSYDPRFLLLFLPPLTVLGADAAVRFWTLLPARAKRPAGGVIAVVVLALTLNVMWISVEYKDDILRNPLMDSAAKDTLLPNRNQP